MKPGKRRPSESKASVREPAGWPIYAAAAVVTILWAGAPIAYAVGYRRGISPLEYEPFALGVFALLAIGPMALVWIAAYALRQGIKLSAEVRRSRETANRLLAPASLAAAEAGTVVEAVRRQIEDASAAAQQARETMSALREALERETERLNEAAAVSGRTAGEIAGTLGAERGRLHGLSEELGAQASAIGSAADKAAEVTASAVQATDGARVASEDLARHVARLESAGAGVGEQMRSVEEGLAQQRASLMELAERLRAEQEGLAAETEGRTARLSDLVVQSRAAAAEVGQSAQQGAEAIQHLTAAAAERFSELTESARRERDAVAAATGASVDQINEAAFEAGRKASERLDALVASAHKASEETKALDAAFQQRVRANYEMLSEAVRLMGLVAGEPAPGAKPAPDLRGRLRLTPVATDQEFHEALETAGAPAEEGLGWKGLLESLDRDSADPEHLTQKMVAEVRGMGVDAAAVLPKGKVDEIAAAVQTGDADGAREVVRMIAASATERLSRRLFTDAALRGQADRYRRRFSGMLKDAAERDQQGFLVGALLASEEGRAFLLLDAAAENRP